MNIMGFNLRSTHKLLVILLVGVFFSSLLLPSNAYCELKFEKEFYVGEVTVDIEDITISPGTLPVYNPCGIKTNGTAKYEVMVEPDIISDSDIKWSIVSGDVSFPGGNTGKVVTVKGNGIGDAKLKVEVHPEATDTTDLKVADEKTVKLKIYVVTEDDGTGAATTTTRIDNDISDANKIWVQCAIKFVKDGSINYIPRSDWLEPSSLAERNLIRDYASGTGAIEIYYVKKFSDEPLTTGATNSKGVVLTNGANSRTFAHEVGHAMGLDHISKATGTNDDEKELIIKLIMYKDYNTTKADIPLRDAWKKKVGWNSVVKYESD